MQKKLKSNNEKESVLIDITLSHEPFSKEPPLTESFLYLNDISLSEEEINAFFITLLNRGDIIAPQYGLPQLAPIDFPELTDENRHPYSQIKSVNPLEALDGNDERIVDEKDLLLISSVYDAVMKDEPTEQFVNHRSLFHGERCLQKLSESLESARECPFFDEKTKLRMQELFEEMNEELSKVSPID
jgi:hypothetical protein